MLNKTKAALQGRSCQSINLKPSQNTMLIDLVKFTPPSLVEELSNLVQPFGSSLAFLRWRRLISPCMAITINCPVLSPGSFTCSIASTISCGTRDANFCDFAFVLFVAITALHGIWWVTVYTENNLIKHLKWVTLGAYSVTHLDSLHTQETAKPGSVGALTGPLTTNDRKSIEVAMSDHTTPLTGRNSLTQNKFTWRFLALNRHDKKAKPCRLSVEAHTEREARKVLAPHFILSLAARLPIREAHHV